MIFRKKTKVLLGEHGQRVEVQSGISPLIVLTLIGITCLFSGLVYKGYSLYLERQESRQESVLKEKYYNQKRAKINQEKAQQGKF